MANNIRILRKRRHWTQAELAEKLGVHSQTVFNWENEDSEPKASQLRDMSELFEVSVPVVMGLEPLARA